MSPRDLPLGARGAAAALVLFASWWLVHAESVTATVGMSAAWIGTGVVAAFALRGMHLPLGLWPEGPMRASFRAGWVIGISGVFAALILLGNPATSSPLESRLDRGAYALVTVGALGWGFAVAFVRQRPFVPWFVAAAVAALAPALAALLGGSEASACWFAPDARQVPCRAGMVQATAFMGASISATALVTSELALRRLLLGRSAGAGLILVLASALVAAIWQLLVDPAASEGARLLWWIGGALAAGSLYARSGSLLVSSFYSGLLAAGDAAVRYGTTSAEPPGGTLMLVTHVAAALVLLGLVARRHGLSGGMRPADDVPVPGTAEATEEIAG